MPLLDIINNVEKQANCKIQFKDTENHEEEMLYLIRSGNIERIFQLDLSKEALIMKYESFLPEYLGLTKIKDYLKSQRIYNYKDLLNIISLWRPNSHAMVERLEQYRSAKLRNFVHSCLSGDLINYLESNFGMILYHEDILKIISFYTKWGYEKCNQLRLPLTFKNHPFSDTTKKLFEEFKSLTPSAVVDLLKQEAPYTFCLPHVMAFGQLTKITAYMKARYKEIYFSEINKWELKNGFCWDDIGIHINGVSLLQN